MNDAKKKDLINEKGDLDSKRKIIKDLLLSDAYMGLPNEEQVLIMKQEVAMNTYSQILKERISLIK